TRGPGTKDTPAETRAGWGAVAAARHEKTRDEEDQSPQTVLLQVLAPEHAAAPATVRHQRAEKSEDGPRGADGKRHAEETGQEEARCSRDRVHDDEPRRTVERLDHGRQDPHE